jgi:hypothetical protein
LPWSREVFRRRGSQRLENEHSNSPRLVWAHFSLGITLHQIGEFASVREHLQQALSVYEPGKNYGWVVDPKSSCLSDLAWVLLMLGYPDQAQQRCEQSIAFARRLDHPFSLCRALGIGAATQGACRNSFRCGELEAECKVLSQQHGFTGVFLESEIYESWTLALEEGRIEQGIDQMRRGLTRCETVGTLVSLAHYLITQGERVAFRSPQDERRGVLRRN